MSAGELIAGRTARRSTVDDVEILAGRVLLRPVDMTRSLAFYRDVLGLAIAREFPGGTVFFLGGGYLEVSGQATASKAKGTAASQQASADQEQTGPGGSPSDVEPDEPDEQVRLWIQVRDLATTYRTLLERGATVVRPPRQEPWGLNEMWVTDPDGLRIGIIEVPPPHPLRRDPRG